MPVQLLWGIRVVVNIDGSLLPFLEPKQRPRKLAVVCCCRDDFPRCDLDGTGGNSDGIISGTLVLRACGSFFGDASVGDG